MAEHCEPDGDGLTVNELNSWLRGLAKELREKADREAEAERSRGLAALRAALADAAGEGSGATDGPPRPPVGPGADEPAGTGETGGESDVP